jgi:transposase-like protein
LTGVDAASPYCYVLAGVEHRDQEIWSWHLLDLMEQGFKLGFTVADGAKGLRAAPKAVMPETSCHSDMLHMQQRQDLRMRDAASRGCRIMYPQVRRADRKGETHSSGDAKNDWKISLSPTV